MTIRSQVIAVSAALLFIIAGLSAFAAWTVSRATYYHGWLVWAHDVLDAHLALKADAEAERRAILMRFADDGEMHDRALTDARARVRDDLSRIDLLLSRGVPAASVDEHPVEEDMERARLQDLERIHEELEARVDALAPRADSGGGVLAEATAATREFDERFAPLLAAAIAREMTEVEHANARIAAESSRLMTMAVIVPISAAVLSLLFCVWFARRLGHRLQSLTAQAERLGAGDLEKPVALDGRDELSAIASTVDRTRAQLAGAQRLLVHAEKLAVAGQLASGVAHEINNPLAVLVMNIEALESGLTTLADHESSDASARKLRASTRAELAEVVAECRAAADQITVLIQSFRSLSLSTSAPEPPEPFEVRAAIADAAARVAARRPIFIDGGHDAVAAAARDDVVSAVQCVLAYLQGRPLDDLQDPGASPVRVEIENATEGAAVRIVDASLEMPLSERGSLFEPRLVVNVDRGRQLRFDVGLALAYQLLARNNARITVADGADGGLAFHVRFATRRSRS